MRFIILIIALILSIPSSLAAEQQYTWPVINVIDGDTIHIEMQELPLPLRKILIRVNGVDTPEKGHLAKCQREKDFSIKATEFTKAFVKEGQVVFKNPKWDKYGGRIDADVYVNGKNLTEELIKQGLGKAYDGGKKQSWCL